MQMLCAIEPPRCAGNDSYRCVRSHRTNCGKLTRSLGCSAVESANHKFAREMERKFVMNEAVSVWGRNASNHHTANKITALRFGRCSKFLVSFKLFTGSAFIRP